MRANTAPCGEWCIQTDTDHSSKDDQIGPKSKKTLISGHTLSIVIIIFFTSQQQWKCIQSSIFQFHLLRMIDEWVLLLFFCNEQWCWLGSGGRWTALIGHWFVYGLHNKSYHLLELNISRIFNITATTAIAHSIQADPDVSSYWQLPSRPTMPPITASISIHRHQRSVCSRESPFCQRLLWDVLSSGQ